MEITTSEVHGTKMSSPSFPVFIAVERPSCLRIRVSKDDHWQSGSDIGILIFWFLVQFILNEK